MSVSRSRLYTRAKSMPLYIMLSGNPCTGKSTWAEKMSAVLKDLNVRVKILNADDIVFQMRDEHNKDKTPDKHIKYVQVFTIDGNVTEFERRFNVLLAETNQWESGVIILDRTYLTPERRDDVMSKIHSDNIHAVYIKINDQEKWRANIVARNASGVKIVPDHVIQRLTDGAIEPAFDEGFKTITQCVAYGEPNSEEILQTSINTVLETIKMYVASLPKPNPQVEQLLTLDCR